MKRLTTKEFIAKAKKVHGDRYDYSTTKYVNTRTVIDICCDEHGIFQQTPSNHLSGQNCPICMNKGKSNNERFINAAKKIHGELFNYSLVNYLNNRLKVKIICAVHGVFEQRPHRHLQGDGCPKCNGGVKISQDDFILRAKMLHGEKYDYSQVNYINSSTKVNIICAEHGIFSMKPNSHLNGQECPLCKNKSFGEKQIYKWLINNSIKFETQKAFSDCRNQKKLPFDFYLSDFNTLIEFDGKQHHMPIDYMGGKNGFDYRKENDLIKTKFAENNNIKLLRISYLERKNLSIILGNNFINI
jgi:hypothetical protein